MHGSSLDSSAQFAALVCGCRVVFPLRRAELVLGRSVASVFVGTGPRGDRSRWCTWDGGSIGVPSGLVDGGHVRFDPVRRDGMMVPVCEPAPEIFEASPPGCRYCDGGAKGPQPDEQV